MRSVPMLELYRSLHAYLFLDNGAVRVRDWYHPFAEMLLSSAGAATAAPPRK